MTSCESRASLIKYLISVSCQTKDGRFPLRRSNSTEYLPRHSSLPGHGSASPNAKQRSQVHRRSISKYLTVLLSYQKEATPLYVHQSFPADVFSSSKLKHSTSDIADKNGVKNRLKKFISRRPSMKTLQEKGLIKGS